MSVSARSALWDQRYPVAVIKPPPSPSPVTIPIVIPDQEQNNWCWVAVGSGIASFYDKTTYEQCYVVTLVFTGLDPTFPYDCCVGNNASTEACNGMSGADQALDHPKHHFAGHAGPLDLAGVTAQIDQGRPFAAEIAWEWGATHFVAVTGYAFVGDPAVLNIQVQDPFWGPSWYEIGMFTNAYRGAGRWFDTTLSQP